MYKIYYYHCVLCALSRFNVLLTTTLIIWIVATTHIIGNVDLAVILIGSIVFGEIFEGEQLLRFNPSGAIEVNIRDKLVTLTPDHYKISYLILLIIIDTIITSNTSLTPEECLEALLLAQFLIWIVTVVDEEIYNLLVAERSNTNGDALILDKRTTTISGGIRVT